MNGIIYTSDNAIIKKRKLFVNCDSFIDFDNLSMLIYSIKLLVPIVGKWEQDHLCDRYC